MKYFVIYAISMLTILSSIASEQSKNKLETAALKCTSDGKVYTIIAINKDKVTVTQELYNWDLSYQAPITVEKFAQNNDSIQIEYTVTKWTTKDEPKTKVIINAKMMINRYTGNYAYEEVVTLISHTNQNYWTGNCQKADRIF